MCQLHRARLKVLVHWLRIGEPPPASVLDVLDDFSFTSRTSHDKDNICIGRDNPNSKTEKVDIVGHCWFFKREWLSTFWRELPPNDFSNIAGEDIHFSYTIQKYLGLETFVPPHPPNDFDLWGSNPKLANLLGNDNKGISSKVTTLYTHSKL